MDEGTVFFLDGELAAVSICDTPVSLEYTERFDGVGEMTCVVPAGSALPPADGFMRRGELLYTVDRVVRDGAAGTVALFGRDILSLFSRRVVPGDLALRLSPEACVCHLAQTYAPALCRELSVVVDGEGEAREIAVAAGDLLERMTAIASSVSKGLRLTYDPTRDRFVLSVYGGADRRLGNSAGHEPAFLSENFGTVSAVRESTDRSRYINRVTVLGEDASGTVLSVTVDAADCGFDDGVDDGGEPTREAVVRSGVAPALYTYGGAFDRAGYLAALRERGRRELASRRAVRTLRAELTESAGAALGDVCSVYCGSDVTAARLVARRTILRGGELCRTAELAAC